MKNFLENIEAFLEPIGYTTTTIGTIVGIVALVMTIQINSKTNKIQKNMNHFKLKASFNVTRLEVITKIKLIHVAYKKGNYLIFEINEVFIDLIGFESIYTKSMKDLLKKLEDNLSKRKENKGKIPKIEIENMILNLYNLQRKLENNIDIITDEVGETHE